MSLQKRFDEEIKKAVEIIKQGGVVSCPTDTCYGLICDATNLRGITNLYKIKGREVTKPTHILVSNIEMVKKFVEINKNAEKLFKHFSIGILQKPLTIVLKLKLGAPQGLSNISDWPDFLLGVRISNHPVTNAIIKELNGPIAVPSANPAGEEAPYSNDDVKKLFEKKQFRPSFYLDGGTLQQAPPSTIIACVDETPEILRVGNISYQEIISLLS